MAVRGSRSVISWMTVCVSIVIVLSRIVGVHLKSISPILPREREKATAKGELSSLNVVILLRFILQGQMENL